MFNDKHPWGAFLICCICFSSHGNIGARSPHAAMCGRQWQWRALQEFRGNHSTLLWSPSCGFDLDDTQIGEETQKTEIQYEFTTKIWKRKGKIKTCFDVDKHSGRCARKGQMRHSVQTDQTLEEVALFSQSGLHLFPLLEVENTNFRSVNSGTVVLLWPPAEPPALLEATQRDISTAAPLAVGYCATAAVALLLLLYILGNTLVCFLDES